VARTASLCLLCVVLLPLATEAGKKNQPGANFEKAASITAMLQHARVFRRTQMATPIMASYGMELTWNDIVQTDPNGRVRVRMTDDSLLSIGANSELRITSHDPKSHRTQVELAYGLLRAQIKKLAVGDVFEVQTPSAVAGVIVTDFGIDASDPNHVKFICIEGTVQIKSLDPNNPGTVNCEGGHGVTADHDKAPNKPEDVDTSQMARWRRITNPDTPDY